MPSKKPNTFKKSYEIPAIQERYDIIRTVIELKKKYEWFTKGDIAYFVKVLLENGVVCISEKAYLQYMNGGKLWKADVAKSFNKKEALDRMLTCHQQEEYLQTRINRKVLSWEHIVPTSVLVEELLKLDKKGSLSEKKIKEMIKQYGFVCIVTKEESKRLDQKYKATMPHGWKYGDKVCARYDEEGIKIMSK